MTATADWCLCTIPLSVLNQIDLDVGAPMMNAINAVPYEDGVGERRLADQIVPFIDRDLAGDQCSAAAVAVFDDFEHVVALLGPLHDAARCGMAARRCRIGSAKAAVLPVPVCAMPHKSRPLRTGGIAWHWIGVGSKYPAAVRALRMGAESPRSEKSTKTFTVSRVKMPTRSCKRAARGRRRPARLGLSNAGRGQRRGQVHRTGRTLTQTPSRASREARTLHLVYAEAVGQEQVRRPSRHKNLSP
jgi:hypothetical protein